MSEHDDGNMDIEEHEKTFEGFARASAWSAVAVIVILLFLALVNA